MNRRLQFRHHSEVFETRELAIEYIFGSLDGDAAQNYSLYAEPTVLRYKNEEDETNPHVILAIGADTNTSDPIQYSQNRFCIIDIDKSEAEIEELREEIEEVIGKIKLITIDTNTLSLESEVTDEGIILSGNTRLAESQVFDSVVRDNIIMETTDGLFTFVKLEYDEDSETFTFMVNGDKSEFRMYNDYVVSGSYKVEDESIHLQRRYGEEMVISLENLIDEWKVEGSASTTPVILTREKRGYGDSGEGHEHSQEWQDILRGDVRISSDSDNIIERADNGQSLLVRGTADNIRYEDETVKSKLDRCKISTDSANNILFRNNDGIFASITLDYNAATNTLILSASNQEDKEIKLNGVEFIDDITYDSEREVIVIRYKDSNGNIQRLEIPAKDIIEEWEVYNEGHSVELTRLRVEDGKDQLSADVKISAAEDNIIEEVDHALFVKGTADNIKYYDDVTVRDALDNARQSVEAVSAKTDELEDEIAEISATTAGAVQDIDHAWKTEGEVRDMSILIDKTDPAVPLIKVSLSESEDNIVKTESDGILAVAKMSYDPDENAITFTNTNGSEVFHLESGNQIRDIHYDKETEELVIVYVVDGEEREMRVPMGDLIEEWEVDNVNKSVKLTKQRVLGSDPDVLSAEVNISAAEDNIIERVHEVIGGEEVYALKVSNDGIVQNTAAIQELQNLTESMNTAISGLNEVNIEQDREISELTESVATEASERQEADAALSALIGEVSGATSGKIASITNTDHAISIDTTDETNPVIGVNLSVQPDHGMDNIIRKNTDGLYAGVSLTYDPATNSLTFSTTNTSEVIRMTSNSIIDKIYYDSSTESIVVEYTVNGTRMPDVVIPVSQMITEWDTVNTPTLELTRTRSVPGPDTLYGRVLLDMNHTDNLLTAESGLYVPGAQISANTQAISSLTDALNAEVTRSVAEDELLESLIGSVSGGTIDNVVDTDTIDLSIRVGANNARELAADAKVADEQDNILEVKRNGGLYVPGAQIEANTQAIEVLRQMIESGGSVEEAIAYVNERLGSGYTGENSGISVTDVTNYLKELIGSGFDGTSLTDVIGSDFDGTSIFDIVGSGFDGTSLTDVITDNELVISEALNDLNNRIHDAEASIVNTNTRIDNAESEISEANDRIDNAEDAIYDANTRIDNAEDGISSANTRIGNAEDEIEELRAMIESGGSAVEVREYVDKKLGSGFTGENSAVTVTQVIEDNEEVISEALNDLNKRIDNIGETIEEYISDIVGEGFSGKTITEAILADEEVTSYALNDLNTRVLALEDFDIYAADSLANLGDRIDNIGETIEEYISDIVGEGFSGQTITEAIIEDERVISEALNDLNSRIIDLDEDVQDVAGDVTDIQGDVNDVKNDITILQNEMDGIQESMDNFYTKDHIDQRLGSGYSGSSSSSITQEFNYIIEQIGIITGGGVTAYDKAQMDARLGTRYAGESPTGVVTNDISALESKMGSAFTGSSVSSVTDYIIALSSSTPSDVYTKTEIDNVLGTGYTVSPVDKTVTEVTDKLRSDLDELSGKTPDAYTKSQSNAQLGSLFSGTPQSSVTQVVNAISAKTDNTYTKAENDAQLGSRFSGSPASSVTQVINDLESKVGSCVTTSQLDTKLGSAFTGSNVSSVTDYIVALSSNTPSDFYSKAESNKQLGSRFSGDPASSVTDVVNSIETNVGNKVDKTDYNTKLGSAFTGANSSVTITSVIDALSAKTNDCYTKQQIDDALGSLITVTSITSSVTDYIEMVSFVNSQAYNDLMSYCQQLEARIHALENQP